MPIFGYRSDRPADRAGATVSDAATTSLISVTHPPGIIYTGPRNINTKSEDRAGFIFFAAPYPFSAGRAKQKKTLTRMIISAIFKFNFKL
jgi:hypothetical protein